MVIATAERHVQIYNLSNPSTPFKVLLVYSCNSFTSQTIQSPLKWQTRVVSCFPNFAGFAIGSIEGRVGIQYVEDKDASYVMTESHPRQSQFLFQMPSR